MRTLLFLALAGCAPVAAGTPYNPDEVLVNPWLQGGGGGGGGLANATVRAWSVFGIPEDELTEGWEPGDSLADFSVSSGETGEPAAHPFGFTKGTASDFPYLEVPSAISSGEWSVTACASPEHGTIPASGWQGVTLLLGDLDGANGTRDYHAMRVFSNGVNLTTYAIQDFTNDAYIGDVESRTGTGFTRFACMRFGVNGTTVNGYVSRTGMGWRPLDTFTSSYTLSHVSVTGVATDDTWASFIRFRGGTGASTDKQPEGAPVYYAEVP